MGLKEKWLKLRNIFELEYDSNINVIKNAEEERIKNCISNTKYFTENTPIPAAEALSEYINSKFSSSINLDDKVDEFINWYYENMVKGEYTAIDEYHRPRELRDFIEKVAVWYELRYPDYEVNRLIPCFGREQKNINEEMFVKNLYIDNLLEPDLLSNKDKRKAISKIEWDEFYNFKVFLNSLPFKERFFFSRIKYRSIVYVDKYNHTAHFHLTKKGFVEEVEGIDLLPRNNNGDIIRNSFFKGKHIKEVVKIMKEKGIYLPENNEFEEAIRDYENGVYQKEEMLNCIMYRIIERGGNRIGPRRAFLFAKEFGRNIDIPMMYGVDYSDHGLRKFINEYIKAGGSKDLVCYIGYLSRGSKYEKLNTITVQELIKKVRNDCVTKYTKEERDLHQKLVNILAGQVDQEEVRKEQVKQLRLERKLYKSMNIKK